MSVRRSASLAVAAIGFVTLAACSSSSSSSGSPGSAASSPAKLKSIFFANPLPAYPDWATADKCFDGRDERSWASRASRKGRRGCRSTTSSCSTGSRRRSRRTYDALMAVPITPSAYEPLFQRAKKQGMESRRSTPATATKTQDLEVGTDYATQGAQVAANIGKRPGQQNVGIITNRPAGSAT